MVKCFDCNNNIDENKEMQNCNFVKTMLMLAVVLSHSVAFWGGGWFSAYIPSSTFVSMKYLSKWTSTFHVYGFALVSGYIYYYLYNVKNKYRSFSCFVLQKLKRLIVPYFFVCLIWVIPITVYYEKISSNEIISNYIFGINPSQLWFLLALFWCYIICWIIIKYIKRSIMQIFVSFILYAISIVGQHFFLNFFSCFRGLQFVIFFISGYTIKKIMPIKHQKLYIFLGAILHIVLFVGQICIKMNGSIQLGYDLVLHLVGSITAFELLLFIGLRIDWSDSKIIRSLIKYSMPIYLFHQQIIYFVIALMNNKIHYVYIIICSYILSISGSIVIGYLLKKNKISSSLIGEK